MKVLISVLQNLWGEQPHHQAPNDLLFINHFFRLPVFSSLLSSQGKSRKEGGKWNYATEGRLLGAFAKKRRPIGHMAV